MRRPVVTLALALVAGVVSAQESPTYAPGENPFQAEYSFALGQPVEMRVVVDGVRLDDLTLAAAADVRPGEKVTCNVVMAGSSTAQKKATLTTVLLLEDANSKGLGRVTLDPFKAKSGKNFREEQTVTADGDALIGARKVYVFIQIDF